MGFFVTTQVTPLLSQAGVAVVLKSSRILIRSGFPLLAPCPEAKLGQPEQLRIFLKTPVLPRGSYFVKERRKASSS